MLGARHARNDSYGEVCTDDTVGEPSNPTPATTATTGSMNTKVSIVGAAKGILPKMSKVTNTEKTLLLSSDDEFQ